MSGQQSILYCESLKTDGKQNESFILAKLAKLCHKMFSDDVKAIKLKLSSSQQYPLGVGRNHSSIKISLGGSELVYQDLKWIQVWRFFFLRLIYLYFRGEKQAEGDVGSPMSRETHTRLNPRTSGP